MPVAVLYVTYPERAVADRVSRSLLNARLVACAVALDARSAYRWEGAIEEASETVVVYKTRPDLVAAAEAMVLEDHPYDVPCVLSWAVSASRAYEAYVNAETVRTT